MKKANSVLIVGMTLLAAVGVAYAQSIPKIGEMKPGKYDYNVEVNNPAIPFKMPPMKFTQCVSAKDLDEGRAFQSQKDAGIDCTYSNIKTPPGAFQFNAVCKMKGGLTMHNDYDGKITGTTVTMNIKQKLTGGEMPDGMRNSTSKMVMTRLGDC